MTHLLQTGSVFFGAFKPYGFSSFVFKKKFPFKLCGVAYPIGYALVLQKFEFNEDSESHFTAMKLFSLPG